MQQRGEKRRGLAVVYTSFRNNALIMERRYNTYIYIYGACGVDPLLLLLLAQLTLPRGIITAEEVIALQVAILAVAPPRS